MSTRDAAGALLLSVACAAVFLVSPRQEPGDGIYTMLTSASLVQRGTFDLDQVVPPSLIATSGDDALPSGAGGPLSVVDGHARSTSPPGAALLSIPFVPLLDRAPPGPTTVREAWAQRIVAGLLMGALAGVLYLLARLYVPLRPAAVVAIAASLGTSVWSVASRGLWSHTWTVLLVATALLLVARAEAGRSRPWPVAVVVLVTVAYVTRPDAVGVLLPLLVHAGMNRTGRARFVTAIVGAVAAIAGLAWVTVSDWFIWPGLGIGVAPRAVPSQLLAQLVSPSRGLIPFVPTVLVVAYLAVRYRVGARPLVRLDLVTIALHAILQAWNHQWYGGHTYGPRLYVELVPFIVHLCVVGLAARQDALAGPDAPALNQRRAERAWFLSMIVLASLIHGRGAWSARAWRWNWSPHPIEDDLDRIWDWRQPQMLAGLVAPVRPTFFPLWPNGVTLEAADPAVASSFGKGWEEAEGDFRWALGPEAELLFAHEGRPGPLLLRLLGFSLEQRTGSRQRLEVECNGRAAGTIDIGSGTSEWRSILLDGRALGTLNIVRLRFPDATSPRALGQGDDDRVLGFAVRKLRLENLAALPADGRMQPGREDHAAYLGTGWGQADGELRGMEGTTASLLFSDAPPETSLLAIEVVHSSETPSALKVAVNGNELEEVTLPPKGPVARTILVPAGALSKDNVLVLEKAPTAVVGVSSVAFRRMARYPEPGGIRPADPAHATYLLSGWSVMESDGSPFRWSDGPKTRAAFSVDDPQRYRVLRVSMQPYLDEGVDAQRVEIALNGLPLAPLVLRSPAPQEFPLALPRGLMGTSNVLVLTLPDARSPSRLGHSQDTRTLGVAVQSIRLTN